MVTREKKPGENWVKYSLNVQGASGKLKTVLIGDHLTHLDLAELEQERKQYFDKISNKPENEKVEQGKSGSGWFGGQQKQESKSDAASEKPVTADVDYVPVDFDAYSIPDLKLQNIKNDKSLSNEDKIWRISSLTASVDDETKILILPLPESKRKLKIADTFY